MNSTPMKRNRGFTALRMIAADTAPQTNIEVALRFSLSIVFKSSYIVLNKLPTFMSV